MTKKDPILIWDDSARETGEFMEQLEIEDTEGNVESNDMDTCTSDVSAAFISKFHLKEETAISLKKTYILDMCGTITCNPKLAIGLSDCTCSVYDLNGLSRVTTLTDHKASISRVKFSPIDGNLLYSCSMDGTIKLWDLRTKNNCVTEYKDNSEGEEHLKPLTCFDVSFNSQIMCAGTSEVESDVFLLFWDLRAAKLLGGYWQSHTDDITQVSFHPTKQDILVTGSTDGLINMFDISKDCEDDALLHSLNTESSVSRISWGCVNGDDILSCTTHTEDLQLWKTDGASPFSQFSRDKVTQSLMRKSVEDCYLVSVHQNTSSNDLIILAGSTAGYGECLRTLTIEKEVLKPSSDFKGNKQIVRTSWYEQSSGVLVTAGEGGFITVWAPGDAEESESSEMKVKQKHKTNQRKPY